MTIKQIVRKLIKKYDTRDLYRLADMLDIDIQFREMNPLTKGMFLHHIRFKRIIINSLLDEQTTSIVLAHELGHAVLHSKNVFYFIKEKSLFPSGRYEREANKFAAELLISDNHEEFFREYGYIRVAQCLGVPIELAEYKFIKQEHLC